jgi:response regulator NasT
VNAVIISSNNDLLDNISITLKEYGIDDVSVSDGVNARQLFETNKYDLVIVSIPLATEVGLELVSFISKKSDAGIIVLVPQKNADEIAKKLSFTSAYILARPVNKFLITQTIRFLLISRETVRQLREENVILENKLHDIKLIDRAKCVLIEYLRISETEAHRQIQKRAMDQRISLVSVAQDILRTYEM